MAILAFLTAGSLFAWPPIPKAIAVGEGYYSYSQLEAKRFLWMVGQSMTKDRNVYLLISSRITDKDRILFEETNVEVILYDEGSILFRLKMDTAKKSSEDIAREITGKVSSICPKITFAFGHALYNPRF